MSTPRARVGYAVLADSHKEGERGKFDLFGVFSRLRLWATPAQREVSLAIAIRDLPLGRTDFSLWIRRGKAAPEHVGTGNVEAPDAADVIIFARRVTLRIKGPGAHEIGLAVGSTSRGAFWIPLHVEERDWPQLPTGKKLRQALEDPDSIKSARAVLHCNKCDSEFIFQKDLDPTAELPPSIRRFPEDGLFVCPECESTHFLKDIEGQIIAQLGKAQRGGA